MSGDPGIEPDAGRPHRGPITHRPVGDQPRDPPSSRWGCLDAPGRSAGGELEHQTLRPPSPHTAEARPCPPAEEDAPAGRSRNRRSIPRSCRYRPPRRASHRARVCSRPWWMVNSLSNPSLSVSHPGSPLFLMCPPLLATFSRTSRTVAWLVSDCFPSAFEIALNTSNCSSGSTVEAGSSGLVCAAHRSKSIRQATAPSIARAMRSPRLLSSYSCW